MCIASPARWLFSPFPPELKLPYPNLQADKKPFQFLGAFRTMYKRRILLLSLSCRNMRSPTSLLSFFLPFVTLRPLAAIQTVLPFAVLSFAVLPFAVLPFRHLGLITAHRYSQSFSRPARSVPDRRTAGLPGRTHGQ